MPPPVSPAGLEAAEAAIRKALPKACLDWTGDEDEWAAFRDAVLGLAAAVASEREQRIEAERELESGYGQCRELTETLRVQRDAERERADRAETDRDDADLSAKLWRSATADSEAEAVRLREALQAAENLLAREMWIVSEKAHDNLYDPDDARQAWDEDALISDVYDTFLDQARVALVPVAAPPEEPEP